MYNLKGINFGIVKVPAPVEIEKKKRPPVFLKGFHVQQICKFNQEVFGKDAKIFFIRFSPDNQLILLNIWKYNIFGEIMYLLKVSPTSLTEVSTEFQVIQFRYIDAQFLNNNFEFIICWRTQKIFIGLFQYSNNSWKLIQQIDSFSSQIERPILVSPDDKYLYVFSNNFVVCKRNSVTLDFEKQQEIKINFNPTCFSLSKSGQYIALKNEKQQLIIFFQINKKWTIFIKNITLIPKFPWDQIQFYGDNLIMFAGTLVWWNKWQRKTIRKQKVKLSPFHNQNNTLSYDVTSDCCVIQSLRGFEFEAQSAIQFDNTMEKLNCSGDGSKLIIIGSKKVKIYEQVQQ